MLRPGVDLLDEMGGVHEFIGWNGSILSDSGGFQVFSLAEIRKVREEGRGFKSHRRLASLSPEGSIEIRERMGVDIAMAFDDARARGSTARTSKPPRSSRTAGRALAARARQALGLSASCRNVRRSPAQERRAIGALDFDGVAIGGVSVGGRRKRCSHDAVTAPLLPEDKPRYLMGSERRRTLSSRGSAGIDMFDCVLPTRNARNGRSSRAKEGCDQERAISE
jgi:queuine tRNA-ribosyltransferase